ncbi:MAG: cytochrome P450 [Acidimicrobiia bacterium]
MLRPPVLGASGPLGHTRAFTEDPLGMFSFLLDTFPDEEVVRVRFGPFMDYIVTGADAARELMLGGHDRLVRPWFFNRVFKEMTGLNLFTANGEEWSWRRKMIGPAFHSAEIAEMANTMVSITERVARSWDAGDRLDLREEMTSLTLEVAGRALFGIDVRAEDRGHRLALGFEGMIEWTNHRVERFLSEPVWAPTFRAFRARRAIGVVDAIAAETVAERRGHEGEHHDLLQLLLNSRDAETGEPLTDHQVVSEAKAFFFAGHETTSSALSWAWLELARHPDVGKALRKELTRVLGGRSPQLSDLENLDLTRRVIEESLRLHPPAMVLTRRTLGAVEAGGYSIPANRGILVLIYAIHRNPKYWDAPHTFDPERFTTTRSAGRPAHAFLPFGEGPRMCIGSRFAMTEACLLLATLAQRWRFEVEEPIDVRSDTRLVLKPARLAATVVGH